MRRFLNYFFSILLLSCFVIIFYLLVVAKSDNDQKYLSPLPDFLTLGLNKQVTVLDLWSPIIEKFQGDPTMPPDYTAKSVLVYDLTSDKTLFEHDSKLRLPMASLTKIMTAIISLENKKPDDSYYVSGRDLVGEDSMGLGTGEVLTQEELLYGLMLPSGNDAAEVLADNFNDGGRDNFIKAMNDKAKSLGLKDTIFSNPSGLQGDGVQYTTASDLLVVTRYALENFTLFGKIVSTYEKIIPASISHKEYDLINETNLLTTYPGVKGIKTGYTPEAGLCLVTLLDYEGHQIIGIILNSENRREEMRNFLDFSLKKLDIVPPDHE